MRVDRIPSANLVAMPVPILSVAQMREWEAATWAAGQSESAVIGRVGEIVAARARQLTRSGDRILVLAGKGHNGDDARQARPHLTDRAVEGVAVTNPLADLQRVRAELDRRPALIIDGLFGIGLNRPLAAGWIDLLAEINGAVRPVLAVDVPSGLSAETGEPYGAALCAAVTLTLGAPKAGLLRPSAARWVGRLEVAPSIGLVPCPFAGELRWTLPDDFDGFPPPRRVDAHKGGFGHLTILAGSVGYHGAAVLAARGAERATPGLITLGTAEEVYGPVAAQLQSVMVHRWGPDWVLPAGSTALVVGPGLAAKEIPSALRDLTGRLWRESELAVLVDASALDWLPAGPTPTGAVRVITPHPGEAARLLRTTPTAVQADRVATVRRLSQQWGGCWVVLKGHQTLVGRDRGEVFVNSSGNPHLAQGGSGDVLAGFLGGLLAQPALGADPSTTLRYGVWQHGAAADLLQGTRAGWTIADLVDRLGGQRPVDFAS
jgi:ADP-dependent NAD(P)H-hydrate dehydratase / NAD(P)H-hydrate epimerase